MRPGEIHRVEIGRLSAKGTGIGRVEGVDVMVDGTFPGETVRAQIEHRSPHRRVVLARCLEIERAHPARRSSLCRSHREHETGRCGGCALLTLQLDAQREIKRAMLAEGAGIDVDRIEAIDSQGIGYRWSSKRVAGRVEGRIVFGSYEPGSHRVAAMDGCLVEHPAIVRCLSELEARTNELQLSVYDESTRDGDLRYVWLKTNGDEVLLTIVTSTADTAAARRLAEVLRTPASMWWSVQSSTGNAWRGQAPKHLAGEQSLSLRLADTTLQIGPQGFLQPNPRLIELAYRDLVSDENGDCLQGPLAVDLYAGAGVTTHLLRRRFDQVRACEAYPDPSSTEAIEPSTAESFLRRQSFAELVELVVANPPRAGMSDDVCQLLLQLGPRRIHIMSCNPLSLARNLEVLERGGYRRLAARAYDTLPHTPHLEVVVWLERQEPSQRTTSGGEFLHAPDGEPVENLR